MTDVIRLIGRFKGQRAEVPYHVAQMNVASMGGNGNMCLPDEMAEIRVEGLDINVEAPADEQPEPHPVMSTAPAEPATADDEPVPAKKKGRAAAKKSAE